MTIAELLAATGLTANDLVPIWDAEAAQNVEPTQKVTATQLAAAVKVLASLVNTTEMNTAIQQRTAWVKAASFTGITLTATSASFTEKVVPELANAIELLFVINGDYQRIVSLQTNQGRIYSQFESIVFGVDGSRNYDYSCMVEYIKSTKTVGIRQTYKGANADYATLSEVWYR